MQNQSTTTLTAAQLKLQKLCGNLPLASILLAAALAARRRTWRLTVVLVGRFAHAWARVLIEALRQEYVPVPVGFDDVGPTGRKHLLQVVARRMRTDEGHEVTTPPPLVLQLAGLLRVPYWLETVLDGGVAPTEAHQVRPPGLVVLLGERQLSLLHGDRPGTEPTAAPTAEAVAQLREVFAELACSDDEAAALINVLPRLKEGLAAPAIADEQPLLDCLAEAFDGRGFRASEGLTAVEASSLVVPWLHGATPHSRTLQLGRHLSQLALVKLPGTVVTEGYDSSEKVRMFRVVRVPAGGGGPPKKGLAVKSPRPHPHTPGRRGGAK